MPTVIASPNNNEHTSTAPATTSVPTAGQQSHAESLVNDLRQKLDIPSIAGLSQVQSEHLGNVFSYFDEDDARNTVRSYLKVSIEQINRWEMENKSNAGALSFVDTCNQIRQNIFNTKSWWPKLPDSMRSSGKYYLEGKRFARWAKNTASDDIKSWSHAHVIPCTGPTKDECIPFVTPEIAKQYTNYAVALKTSTKDAGIEMGDSSYKHVVNMIRNLMRSQMKLMISFFVGSSKYHLTQMDCPVFNGKSFVLYW